MLTHMYGVTFFKTQECAFLEQGNLSLTSWPNNYTHIYIYMCMYKVHCQNSSDAESTLSWKEETSAIDGEALDTIERKS